MARVVKLVVKLLIFFLAAFFSYSLSLATSVYHVDSQSPSMLFNIKAKMSEFGSVRIEKDFSNQIIMRTNGIRHSEKMSNVMTVQYGKSLTEDLFLGIQFYFGEFILDWRTNFNIQYDLLKNDFFKFGLLGVYGGVLNVNNKRAGVGTLAAFRMGEEVSSPHLFLSFQSMKVDKDFLSWPEIDRVEAKPKYNLILVGFESADINKNLTLVVFGGLNQIQSVNKSNLPNDVADYDIEDGNWFGIEMRAYTK